MLRIGGETYMKLIGFDLSPVAALVFGVLILLFPKLLNYWIAIYLIIVGLAGLGLLS